VIVIRIRPQREKLRPFILLEQGKITEINGIALSSLLRERKVSERMAKECQKELRAKGYNPKIEIVYDAKEDPAFKKPQSKPGLLWQSGPRRIPDVLLVQI
jgi:RNA 3'-terminal phosphate cyclase (ATP)